MHILLVYVRKPEHCRTLSKRRVFTLRLNALNQESAGLAPRRAKSAAAASASLTALIVETLEDAKAEEIVSIPLADKTSLADFMIVARGVRNAMPALSPTASSTS